MQLLGGAVDPAIALAYQKRSETFGIPAEQMKAGLATVRQQNPETRRLVADEKTAANASLLSVFGPNARQIPEWRGSLTELRSADRPPVVAVAGMRLQS